MNQRGQFFLVAALVIVGILIGLAGVYTQVNTPQEDYSLYDLSSELNYESLQVIDHGVYTELSDEEINAHISNLTNYYATKNPNKDFAIVYGDEETLTVVSYTTEVVGAIGVSTGGSAQRNIITKTVSRSEDQNAIGDNIVIKFKGNTYNFKVSAGTSFYSVLTSESGNQKFVAAEGSTNSGSGDPII